jgi:hypothetical protein
MIKQIEIFKCVSHALLYGHIANAVQRIAGFHPHAPCDSLGLCNRNAAITKACAMEIQTSHT